MLQTVKATVTTTGQAGQAVGTGYSAYPVAGEIRALYVDWHADAPGTSDITVTVEADDAHPAITLYSKDNSVSDAWVYPQVQATGTDGAGIANLYQHILGAGRIKIAVAGCDALDPAVTVYAYVWTGD